MPHILDSFERKRNKLQHANPRDGPCGHRLLPSLFYWRLHSGKHLITRKETPHPLFEHTLTLMLSHREVHM